MLEINLFSKLENVLLSQFCGRLKRVKLLSKLKGLHLKVENVLLSQFCACLKRLQLLSKLKIILLKLHRNVGLRVDGNR